jgi:hypothetical protein
MMMVNINPLHRNRRSREGAAMLVVLMILMVATATAAMAVQSTNMELRSAGYQRREAQTKYVSEAGLVTALGKVDGLSLEKIYTVINSSGPQVMGVFNEPEMDTDKKGIRIYSDDYSDLTTPPIAGGNTGTLGPGQSYDPWFVVDLYDQHFVDTPIAGDRADGGGYFKFLYFSLVSRGFTVPVGTALPQSTGGANQAANTTCGSAVLGPFFILGNKSN